MTRPVRDSLPLVAACATAIALLLPAAPSDAAPDGFDVDTIASLEFPTQMAFTPSGRVLFVNEREGRIRVIRDGKLASKPFATIDTDDTGEGGLLGLAVDPKFDEGEPWLYAFHSSDDGSKDMVTRIKADGLRGSDREVIIDDIPASSIHHGGVIAFGPDGKLYVTNGDHADSDSAQDRRAFGGKVYRVEPDGSVPNDNPFGGSRTWSYGHRNMFGIAFDADGELWVSENGDDDHDEINHVRKGKNYGWPRAEGRSGDDRFVDPVVDYEQIIVPTGIGFATGVLGDKYEGDLFLGTFAQRSIRRIRLDGDRATDDSVFHDGEQIVALLFGPDGLYYSTPDKVRRIKARGFTPSPTPTDAAPSASPSSPGAEQPQDARTAVIGIIILSAFGAGGFLLARALRERQKAAR